MIKERTWIAVTGSNGRLGRAVVDGLLAHGYNVKTFDLDAKPAAERWAEWVRKDRLEIWSVDLLRTPAPELAAALRGCQGVIHLAGLISYTQPFTAIMAVNVEGTKNVLTASKTVGVKRFVFASSTAVYGNPDGGPHGEDYRLKPVSAYGASKRYAEDEVRHAGIPYTILRMSVLYGPEFTEGFSTITRAVAQGTMRVIGSGSNRIPLLHVKDAVRAYLSVLETPKAANRTFNVSGEPATQREVLDRLAESLGVAPVRASVPRWVAHAMAWAEETRAKLEKRTPKTLREHVRVLAQDRCFDTRALQAATGWTAKVTPKAGIKEWTAWWQAHAAAFRPAPEVNKKNEARAPTKPTR